MVDARGDPAFGGVAAFAGIGKGDVGYRLANRVTAIMTIDARTTGQAVVHLGRTPGPGRVATFTAGGYRYVYFRHSGRRIAIVAILALP